MNLRNRILILPELQKKIVSPFVWASLGVATLNLCAIAVFLNFLVSLINENADSQMALFALNAISFGIATVLILNLFVIAVFGYFFLAFSNRIAGPVFHIQKALRNFKESGQFDPIQLRESDLLKSLAEDINEALQAKGSK